MDDLDYGFEEILIFPKTYFSSRLDLSVWCSSGYYIIDYAKQLCHIEEFTCY